MAKKRTKADKIKAAARNQTFHQQSVTQPVNVAVQPTLRLSLPSLSEHQKDAPKQQIWRFDPRLIYQDLFKTALASGLIVGILVLIYWLSF